ncbi:uncharacterized protein LOC119297278 isoform X2 [Triticum dicoccoides]|uniref:uncharacterized protein LOC119297278 isoform X2 n=1 Tax=Triticum dicoccoides TaxID=85692 RepID=UPI00188E3D30|nr:uncharacterized protein LOC119297278 isoform X2 [Triticum dicoccoides]
MLSSSLPPLRHDLACGLPLLDPDRQVHHLHFRRSPIRQQRRLLPHRPSSSPHMPLLVSSPVSVEEPPWSRQPPAGATAVEAAAGWSPASSPFRSLWRSTASNLLDGARNPRRTISSSHGHGHGEPARCAAAGALLLCTVCVSSAAVLLEATGVMAAVYGGDHKLSGDLIFRSWKKRTGGSRGR